MRRRAPLVQPVAWTVFVLIVAGAAASIAFDRGEPAEASAPAGPPASTDTTPVAEPAPNSDDADGRSGASAEPAGPRSFTIAATGDLLIHGPVADAARTPDGWDFVPMFAQVAPLLQQADLAVCHLETPLSPNNARLSYYPAFLVPNEVAPAIAQAGYDTCSLASNHATDAGREGVVGTIAALDAAGVAHSGMALSAQDRARLTLIDAAGATVAHLSYSYGFNNGELDADEAYLSNIIDETAILDEARRARAAGADFVVLSMHWGTGYVEAPDELQVDLGPRLLADADIDLILGHHAHVVQPVARIGDEYLVYGMGNFLSNQAPESCSMCPVSTTDGVIVHLTVTEHPADGRWTVTEVSHTPTWVDRTSYEIVDVLRDTARDPALLAESADRTAAALGAAQHCRRGPLTGSGPGARARPLRSAIS